MIAEPLEKGLAEDIENEVVQITWNRYDARAGVTFSSAGAARRRLSCVIRSTRLWIFPPFNPDVVAALLISPYFPAALTHQSASLFPHFAEMSEQARRLRRRLL